MTGRSSPRARNSHIFERDVHDHYVEANWLSERLFDVEDFEGPSQTILDPCCGWGRIPLAAERAGYKAIASDVVDRRLTAGLGTSVLFGQFRPLDILKCYPEEVYEWWRQARSIVSNPPFKPIEDVARRCVALAEYKVALICPVRRLNAAGGWLKELGLSKIWLLTPRPSMPTGEHILNGGKIGGGKQDFCWLIFSKGYTGPNEIDWLHRDGKVSQYRKS